MGRAQTDTDMKTVSGTTKNGERGPVAQIGQLKAKPPDLGRCSIHRLLYVHATDMVHIVFPSMCSNI